MRNLFAVATVLAVTAVFGAADKKKREWQAGTVEWVTLQRDVHAGAIMPAGGPPVQTVRESIDIGIPNEILVGEQTVAHGRTLDYPRGARILFVIEGKNLIVLDRDRKERKLRLKGRYPRSETERRQPGDK